MIEERGGLALYTFCFNSPVCVVELLGNAPAISVGTILVTDVEGVGLVSVTVGANLSDTERNLAEKALCLMEKILERPVILHVPWGDLYWGTFDPGAITGLTAPWNTVRRVTPPLGTRPVARDTWAFLDPAILPPSVRHLVAMVRFGTTLTHESTHYFEPHFSEEQVTAMVDGRVNAAHLFEARFGCCDTPSGWEIRNVLEWYACECNIPVR